jgi:hypothetical protein
LKFPFGPIPLTDFSTIETSWRSRLAPLFQSVLYVLPHRGIAAVEGERVKISFFQQHDPQNSSRSREEEGGTDGLCVHFIPSVTESSNNNQFTGPRENTNIRAQKGFPIDQSSPNCLSSIPALSQSEKS